MLNFFSPLSKPAYRHVEEEGLASLTDLAIYNAKNAKSASHIRNLIESAVGRGELPGYYIGYFEFGNPLVVSPLMTVPSNEYLAFDGTIDGVKVWINFDSYPYVYLDDYNAWIKGK